MASLGLTRINWPSLWCCLWTWPKILPHENIAQEGRNGYIQGIMTWAEVLLHILTSVTHTSIGTSLQLGYRTGISVFFKHLKYSSVIPTVLNYTYQYSWTRSLHWLLEDLGHSIDFSILKKSTLTQYYGPRTSKLIRFLLQPQGSLESQKWWDHWSEVKLFGYDGY